MGELRAPAILALFLGADPAEVARRNLELGEAKLAEYEEMAANFDASDPPIPPGPAPRARGRHPLRARLGRVLA